MALKIKQAYLLFCFLLFSTLSIAQTGNLDEEFKSKNNEVKLTEVVPMDSIMGSELSKRAAIYMKHETAKYKKVAGGATNGKYDCTVSFLIKSKELNPRIDITGKITMKVVIECKDNKFRYIVSEITHISKTGSTNGGRIDNIVPDCGSASMDDVTWKKVKGEAMRDAAMVVSDIKEVMQKNSADAAAENW